MVSLSNHLPHASATSSPIPSDLTDPSDRSDPASMVRIAPARRAPPRLGWCALTLVRTASGRLRRGWAVFTRAGEEDQVLSALPLPPARSRWELTISNAQHGGQCRGTTRVFPSIHWVEAVEHGEDGWGGVAFDGQPRVTNRPRKGTEYPGQHPGPSARR